MVRFVIYADKAEDIEGLDALIRDAVCARGEWPFVQRYIGAESLPRYLTYVRWNPCLVMVVSASGERGCEVAAQIRENNPNARMLWFSGTDSGVYSYSLHVTYFGLLPATREKIELALDLCRINPQQRMAGPSESVAQSTLYAQVGK
ncbi:MAG: hypothetical protein LUG99_09515 [Lachnospiraceae bacterium]|nr:hypothetical protein [Lachnospiraceae bacterium]